MSVGFRCSSISSFRTEGGAGMIEVMIALFVLAIGLLGVLAMQVNGVQSNQSAMFSTEAHILAGDMADRIFAYDAIDDADDNDDYAGIDTDPNAVNPGCVEAGCNRVAQIAYDTWDWKRQIEARLPAGRGLVVFNNVSRMYTITVMWDDNKTGATGTGCGGNPAVDLSCYQLEFAL